MSAFIRPVFFDVNIAPSGKGFFTFGPMLPGEVVLGVKVVVGVDAVLNASIPFQLATFTNKPLETSAHLLTGRSLTDPGVAGSEGVALRHGAADVVFEYDFPFSLPYDDDSRFLMAALNNVNYVGDTIRGYLAFRLQFPSRTATAQNVSGP